MECDRARIRRERQCVVVVTSIDGRASEGEETPEERERASAGGGVRARTLVVVTRERAKGDTKTEFDVNSRRGREGRTAGDGGARERG